MAGPFLIGVDVGTTSVKTALFDAGGALCAQRSSMIETARPAQAFVEQAPEDWISATLSGLAKVLHGVSLDAVAGIGLCSQVNTHVFVDANGQALAPAIVWQDGRCAQEAAKLDRLVSEDDPRARGHGTGHAGRAGGEQGRQGAVLDPPQ